MVIHEEPFIHAWLIAENYPIEKGIPRTDEILTAIPMKLLERDCYYWRVAHKCEPICSNAIVYQIRG